jgi:hypothetical protein
MARIRMVKPDFFDDPDIGVLSPLARLFFIGLWTQADREGRLVDDMRRLKIRIFPFDAVDCEALAVELHGKDMIRRYSAGEKHGFIWIRNFTKHQRPHPKEPASLIPPCPDGAGKRNGEPCKETAEPPESGFLILDSGTRNPSARAEEDQNKRPRVARPDSLPMENPDDPFQAPADRIASALRDREVDPRSRSGDRGVGVEGGDPGQGDAAGVRHGAAGAAVAGDGAGRRCEEAGEGTAAGRHASTAGASSASAARPAVAREAADGVGDRSPPARGTGWTSLSGLVEGVRR